MFWGLGQDEFHRSWFGSWRAITATSALVIAVAVPASAGAAVGDRDGLTDALSDATPQELEERSAAVAKRLAEAGSARELIVQLEAESTQAIAVLDASLRDIQSELTVVRQAEVDAAADLEQADRKKNEAARQAERARSAVRAAAVDLFMNPPQAESLLAALSGTVDEEMASTGLLVGRAEARREVSDLHSRAEDAAERTARSASRAANDAESATKRVNDVAADLTVQLDTRSAELRGVREMITALETEVADLVLTDSVLKARLDLNELAQSGSVTAARGPGGEWIPNTDSLPQPEDMLQIPGTSTWVHHTVYPSVALMFAEAAGDGVNLLGGAYRDSRRQIELRVQNCGSSYAAIFTAPSSSCSPPTARPGRSMHERGLAIDFHEGGSALTKSTASFRWLSRNASRFGFYNLPSEPWHWSVNGR